MEQKDKITGTNIVEDNISTMVNNGDGDIDYNSSPCVVMNNLVKNHNGKADEMGDAAMSSSAIVNKNAQSAFSMGTTNLISNLQDGVKEFDEPVDYETAFEEYYPDDEAEK